MAAQVRTSISNPNARADFDIAAISDEILANYGPAVDVTAIPDDQYWAIVARHDRTTVSPFLQSTAFYGGADADVRQPDERSRPSVAPLWIWWFLFSPVALIWAPIRANQAKTLGYTTGRYWAVFWASFLPIAAAIALIVAAATAASRLTYY